MNIAHDISLRLIVSYSCFLIGAFFLFSSSVGLVRLRGFIRRIHASSVGETTGLMFFMLGAICYHGASLLSAKIGLLWVFLWVANPTATHTLARIAAFSDMPLGKPLEKAEKEQSDV